MGFRVQRKASPRVTSHPPKVPYTLQIYTLFNHVVNPSPLLEAPWCFAGCPIGPFRSPWCLPGCPNGSFLRPWCLQSSPLDPFLPPWCLASATGSQPWSPPQDLPRAGPIAIEIVLKVIQNPAPVQNRDSIGNPALQASLVPPTLSKWLFPASLVPPWCFAGCPIDPFLPPWCLPGCPSSSFLPPWCLPGASQAVQVILSCLPGASQAVQ